ncbi:type VII secretion-associated serine protease mycosin [Motilibacter peucedani]|uniref:Type VII secretion-associated serine protease mycosin n=1 Tax=Motilibacter peucedani TaxID=598650 RepID=A0A420XMZ9_9ACTN|nr:S8 family serine peptidase [Motilibacter peucedani]RKS72658.1 type VII secretion-associated serine protease mycosin [Motilibacter peucedani]
MRRWPVVVGAALLGLLPLTAPPAQAASPSRPGWQLAFLHAAQANRLSTGRGVVVGLVDSGVNAAHPDLAGQVLNGTDFPPAGTHGQRDITGHGSLMAGLIAGTGDGVRSVRGLAPGAKILPVRGGRTYFDIAEAADGVRWAADHGARVINLSFGDAIELRSLAQAVAYAQSKDVVVVAAAGNTNEGENEVTSPASLPGVVAVSAVDEKGAFPPKVSVSGKAVVLSAPGVDIIGPGKGTGYLKGSGTSASTALVSATAALVRARYPKLDAAGVINRLITTADDKGPKGRDPEYGFGIVDPVRALTATVPAVTTNPLLPAAPATPSASPAPSSSASASPSDDSGAAPASDVAAASAAAAAAAAAVAATQPPGAAASAGATAGGAADGSSSAPAWALGGGAVVVLAALGAALLLRRSRRA